MTALERIRGMESLNVKQAQIAHEQNGYFLLKAFRVMHQMMLEERIEKHNALDMLKRNVTHTFKKYKIIEDEFEERMKE